MNKKAELTTQQIVVIVILVASFAVLLFFLMRLNLGDVSEEQICHDSVLRSSKGLVPDKLKLNSLDCNTQYVCISAGSDCDGFTYDEKIDINLGDKLDINKVVLIDKILKQMSDCWWMFGEGEVEFASSKSCGICSIVKFDSEIQNYFKGDNKLTYLDLINYMMRVKTDSGNSYFYYFYGNEKGRLASQIFTLFENDLNQEIDFSKRHAIVTGVMSKGFFRDLVNKIPFANEDNPVFPPQFVESSKLENACDSFVTKA